MFRSENVCYICCLTTYKGMLCNNEQLETPNSTSQQRNHPHIWFADLCIYRFNNSLKINQASLVAQTVNNLPAMQETGLRSLGQENPLQRKWLPTPVFLPGELHGQRSRAGYSPWGQKESETTEQLTHTHTDKKLTTTGFSALNKLSFQSSTNPREKSRLRKKHLFAPFLWNSGIYTLVLLEYSWKERQLWRKFINSWEDSSAYKYILG